MVYTKDNNLREMQMFRPFQRVNPAGDQSSTMHNVGPHVDEEENDRHDYDYIENY